MKCKEIRHILFSTLLVDLILIVIGYYMIPVIFNYPPFSMEKEFQYTILKFTYKEQFLILFSICIILHLLWTKRTLKDIIDYEKRKDNGEKFSQEYIDKIRDICIVNPIRMYETQFFVPQIIIFIFLLTQNVDVIFVIKMITIVSLLVAGGGMYSYIVSKKYYDKIIASTYDITDEYQYKPNKILSMKTALFFQIFPLFLVGIVISLLLGYTRVVNERGNSLYYYYSSQFDEKEIAKNTVNLETLKQNLNKVKLKNPEDFYFIIFPNGYEYKSREDKSLSEFFKKYMYLNYDKTNGRIYEEYGKEEQAFVRRFVDKNGGKWYVGFKYSVSDFNTLYFLCISGLTMIIIYVIITYIWAKNMSLNVNRIVENMNDIIDENKVDLDEALPITSYDELGTLVDSYNRIQKLLSSQIELMEKQAQLATLGELAGGMAHDINTPLASIDNSVTILQDQAEANDKVDSKDILMITSIMDKCVNRITSIINSMRNQIRNLGETTEIEMDLKKVIEDSIIIVNNDIIRNNCKVIPDLKSVTIVGEANKIGQVITNLIVNAAQAYKDKGKSGEIKIKNYSTEKEAIIEIQDFAGGIPEAIRPYIFKNILTTKGISGTGLGLYLAYSIVKGIYGGKITFEVEDGVGTTFIIRIPLKQKKEGEKNGI